MSQNEIFLKTRHVQKHDVEENWTKAVNFIPLKGEMIVYDIDETHSYERFKIGDGVTVVSSLPFTTDALRAELESYVDATVERIVKMALSWGTFPEEPVPDEPTEEEEVLEGSGSEYYTLAPTPLSFRSTAPLNEFQEVQINGVTVDPSNYTLEEGSTIVKLSVDYLKTLDKGNYEVAVVSENKTVKGGFTVAAPELNEHGFYYNQPYAAYMSYFSSDVVMFIRENNTMDILVVSAGVTEVAAYTVEGGMLTITSPSMGTLHCTLSEDGIELYNIELSATLKLCDNEAFVADSDYIYVYNTNYGGYEVTAIDKTKAEYGDIKTGINGVPTVKLAKLMFADLVSAVGNKNMTIAPKIPDTVTVIGDGAFIDCTNLTKVILPESVTTIGQEAFSMCSNLASINIPANLTTVGWQAFEKTYELADIYITSVESCLRIAETFSGKSSVRHIIDTYGEEVTELNIPNIEAIDRYAFAHYSNLTSVVIPDSVTDIGDYAFDGCFGLTSVTIGTNVASIGDYAFLSCSSLTSVTIPDSVTSIGRLAFSSCSSLTSITISDSVTSIGYGVFAYCPGLTSITFNGTISQWNAVEKDNHWNNGVPATRVQCIDGTVAL